MAVEDFDGFMGLNKATQASMGWKLQKEHMIQHLVDQMDGRLSYKDDDEVVEPNMEDVPYYKEWKFFAWANYMKRKKKDWQTSYWDKKTGKFTEEYLDFIIDVDIFPEKYMSLEEWESVQSDLYFNDIHKNDEDWDGTKTDEEYDNWDTKIWPEMVKRNGWDKTFTLP